MWTNIEYQKKNGTQHFIIQLWEKNGRIIKKNTYYIEYIVRIINNGKNQSKKRQNKEENTNNKIPNSSNLNYI